MPQASLLQHIVLSWRLIGSNELRGALAGLRAIARDVRQLAGKIVDQE